ncbi:MAG TPA: glycosyltransferase family 39 protein [Caldisericia bacterium]|nr:glycosyltransferase family 39 protein [Caldisericia bacterium]
MKIFKDKRLVLFLILSTILIVNFIIFVPKFIWGDEAWSATISSMGLIESIKNSLNDFHPPLYHILLSLFLYILPDSSLLLRIISIILGILTIYIVIFKFDKFIGDIESSYLSILLSISPFFLYIFSLVRMYSLSVFLSTLSLLYFFHVNMVSNTKLTYEQRKYFILYIISNLCMMLTHHLTIPLFFLQGFYFLIKKNFKALKTFIITCLIYLPFSYIFYIQLKRRFTLSRGWGNILPETFLKDFFSYLFLNSRNISIFIILIFIIFIIFGLSKFKTDAQKFFIIYFLSYSLMFYIVTIKLGSLYFHYLSFIILPAYFLLTQGIIFFKKYKEKILLFIIIVLFIFTPATFIKAYPEIPKIQNEIKDRSVVFLNRYEMYRYTFGIKGDFIFLMDLPLNNFTIDTNEKIDDSIKKLEEEENSFIFLYSSVGSDFLSIYDPKGKLKKYLEENSIEKKLFGIYSESPVFLYFFDK